MGAAPIGVQGALDTCPKPKLKFGVTTSLVALSDELFNHRHPVSHPSVKRAT